MNEKVEWNHTCWLELQYWYLQVKHLTFITTFAIKKQNNMVGYEQRKQQTELQMWWNQHYVANVKLNRIGFELPKTVINHTNHNTFFFFQAMI